MAGSNTFYPKRAKIAGLLIVKNAEHVIGMVGVKGGGSSLLDTQEAHRAGRAS